MSSSEPENLGPVVIDRRGALAFEMVACEMITSLARDVNG
jgi:hypothetical protein